MARARWGTIRWGIARWWGRVTGAPISIDDRSFSANWEDDRSCSATWDDDRSYSAAWHDDQAFAANWEHDQSYSANWDDDRIFQLKSFAMTKTGVKLTNLVIGDSKRIKRRYDELPEGYTIATAYLTIKKSATQTDAQALVQKAITTSASAAGQITDALTTGGSIAMFFDLSKTDTLVFKAGVEYIYDVQVVLSTGEVHTMEVNTMTWINGVTSASV